MAIILPATDIIIQMARTKNHQVTNPDNLNLRHRNSADFVAIGLDAFNLEKMDSFWVSTKAVAISQQLYAKHIS